MYIFYCVKKLKMNFLLYFFNFYYTIAFKYLCFCFICLFVTLCYFYKQCDYFFLTKITLLTKVVTFKYIDVFDIFICNFKINFLFLIFFSVPILCSYVILDQITCIFVKNIKLIKKFYKFYILFYSIFFIVYINNICINFLKILLSYQIQINNKNTLDFFLSFDLYLANYVNFWFILNILFYSIFFFNILHWLFCYFNIIYYYFNKLYLFCILFLQISIICNSLIVDIFAFLLFLVYFISFYLVLFFLYQIFIYNYFNYK